MRAGRGKGDKVTAEALRDDFWSRPERSKGRRESETADGEVMEKEETADGTDGRR